MPPDVDPSSLAQLGAVVRDLGIIGLLSFAIAAGFRGWIVTKREHEARLGDAQLRLEDERADRQEVATERDEWKGIALELLQTAQRAAGVAERAVGK